LLLDKAKFVTWTVQCADETTISLTQPFWQRSARTSKLIFA